MGSIKHTIIFCGSGGVGKTTLSAATALREAGNKKKVYALTIDPAKRLASILGLPSKNNIPSSQSIDYTYLKASMLNAKKDLIELVKYYCTEPCHPDLILNNSIFKSFLDSISGAEEYIAMGKLFQILQTEECDLLFVDTAPTNYALEFFDGPPKLLNILEPSRLLKLLRPLSEHYQTHSFSPQTKAGTILNKILKSVLGIELIHEVSELAVLLNTMFDDFRKRVHQAYKLLQDPSRTSIVIVICPFFHSIHEASLLKDYLLSKKLPLKAFILNKLTPSPLDFDLKQLMTLLNQHKMYQITSSKNHLDELKNYLNFCNNKHHIEQNLMQRFKRHLPDHFLCIQIPDMVWDHDSVTTLKLLHPYLHPLCNLWNAGHIQNTPDTFDNGITYE